MKALALFVLCAALATTIASATDDTLLWSTPFGGKATSLAHDNDGGLYVVTEGFNLTYINKNTGKVGWHIQLTTNSTNENVLWAPQVAYCGDAVVVMFGFNIIAVDPNNNGKLLWNIPLPWYDQAYMVLYGFSSGSFAYTRGMSGKIGNHSMHPKLFVFNSIDASPIFNWNSLPLEKKYPNADFASSVFQFTKNAVIVTTQLTLKPYYTTVSQVDILGIDSGFTLQTIPHAHSCSFTDANSKFVACAMHIGGDFGTKIHQLAVYDTALYQMKWQYNFSTVDFNNMIAGRNFDLFIADNTLIAAYFPQDRTSQWALAFNVQTGGAPFLNVSLPNNTAGVTGFFPYNGYNIFPLAEGFNRDQVAKVSFYAVDMASGSVLWKWSPPTTATTPLVFLPSGDIIAANTMGWARAKQPSPDATPKVDYINLHEFGGVVDIAASGNNFLVTTQTSLRMYKPGN